MADIITPGMVASICPARPEDGHKGTFGTALIIAGSRYMTGAQTLSVMAALRSGCGMVRVYAPDDSLESTRVNCPCALLSAWGDTETSTIRRFSEYLAGAASVGIGPGLDESDRRSAALLEQTICNAPRLVIDAGALNIIARQRDRFLPLIASRVSDSNLEPAVLTPHVGEFRRLTGCDDITPDEYEEKCVQFALQNKCVTVLKTHKTIVSDVNGKCYINNIGNNGMAKGGCGDVLTGLITGLCAQKIPSFDSAVAGVYLHALSGDLAASDIGRRVMIPEDLPGFFDEAFASAGWD